jgi:hypothetical protein
MTKRELEADAVVACELPIAAGGLDDADRGGERAQQLLIELYAIFFVYFGEEVVEDLIHHKLVRYLIDSP